MVTDEDMGLLSSELAFCDIDASDTDELFAQLGARLAPMGYIEDGWYEAITEREAAYATGLQTPTIGVAIPHADNCTKRAYIAIVKPRHPVTFQPMGGVGGPVKAQLVINLGIMREGGQLEMLQGLMRVFMDDAAAADIMACETPGELVEALKFHLA